MFIIDDLIFSPLNGVVWLGEKINEVLEKEMSDEGKIKERLMKLQLDFELDEISEKEYIENEKEILSQLDAIRKMKEGDSDEQY
ncbi:gas vesicle protein GvpG [Candidatus Poribacteria bacterium]|nr:gas vesicle protein GvpG [Candidatus Poribacteria bacterium]